MPGTSDMVKRTDAEPPADRPVPRESRESRASRLASTERGSGLRSGELPRELRLVRPSLHPEEGDLRFPTLREAIDGDAALPRSRRTARHSGESAGEGTPSRGARRAVTRSNVESAYASDLDPQDPRWLVATETAAQLEGSLLTFERRRRVLAFAERVGVRPFDANLIIAAVQDRARRGEPIDHAKPTVALTAAPRRRAGLLSREALPYVITAILAVVLHVAGAWAIARFWLT